MRPKFTLKCSRNPKVGNILSFGRTNINVLHKLGYCGRRSVGKGDLIRREPYTNDIKYVTIKVTDFHVS